MIKAWRQPRTRLLATALATVFTAMGEMDARGVAADIAPGTVADVVGAEEPAATEVDGAVAHPKAPITMEDIPPEPVEIESILVESMADQPFAEGIIEHAPHEVMGSCTSCTAGGCTGGCERPHAGIGETYWVVDSVFLQRDNQSTDQILAAIGPNAIITTGEPQFAVQPGLRLFRGVVDDCGRGWELGYLGVWNMFADLDEGGLANINGGDPLSFLVDGFDGRSLARATYLSTLNTAEVNLLRRSCHRGFSRHSAYPWERCGNYRRGTLDWLAGFRWAGLDEAASLQLSGGDFPGPSNYNVRSSTNFFGAQIGGRGRMEWDRWAVDGWAKAALAGTAMSQSANPIGSVFVPDPPVRPARSATEGGVGFIGDLNVNLSYRLNETWRLRTGYNFIWLTGVALAPNQFDFGSNNAAGTGLNGGAGVFLHGANLGLEAAW
ncbi:MAG: BBP7 family outer membrane beta-barrel protein [Planctomycetota bacterium]